VCDRPEHAKRWAIFAYGLDALESCTGDTVIRNSEGTADGREGDNAVLRSGSGDIAVSGSPVFCTILRKGSENRAISSLWVDWFTGNTTKMHLTSQSTGKEYKNASHRSIHQIFARARERLHEQPGKQRHGVKGKPKAQRKRKGSENIAAPYIIHFLYFSSVG